MKRLADLIRECLIEAVKSGEICYVLGDQNYPKYICRSSAFDPSEGWVIHHIEWPVMPEVAVQDG